MTSCFIQPPQQLVVAESVCRPRPFSWAIYLYRKETCCPSEATLVIYYRSWLSSKQRSSSSSAHTNRNTYTVELTSADFSTGPAKRDDIIRIRDVIYLYHAFSTSSVCHLWVEARHRSSDLCWLWVGDLGGCDLLTTPMPTGRPERCDCGLCSETANLFRSQTFPWFFSEANRLFRHPSKNLMTMCWITNESISFVIRSSWRIFAKGLLFWLQSI